MPLSRTIPLDLPCARCSYNLRGLHLEAQCPECSTGVRTTLATIELGNRPDLSPHLARLRSHWVEEAARIAGVSRDAVMFVGDAKTASPRVVTAEPDRYVDEQGMLHLTARDLCARVHDFALYYFNGPDEARERLAQWGLRSSEDVGRIIFTLVEMGLLSASPKDDLHDFDGLFTLEKLFGKDDSFIGLGNRQRALEAAMPAPPVLLSRRPVFSFFCLACLAAAAVVAIVWVRSYFGGDAWVRWRGGRGQVVASSRGLMVYRRDDAVPTASPDMGWIHLAGVADLRAVLGDLYDRRWRYGGFYRARIYNFQTVSAMPHAAPLALLLVPPGVWLFMQRKLARRVTLGQCLGCGEALPESAKESCPACGEAVADEVLRRRECSKSGPLAY